MKKKVVLAIALMCIINTVAANTVFNDNQRETYNFNSAWKLKIGDIKGAENALFNDQDWKSVTLPHAFNEDEAFRVSIEELTDTIVWYRKYFKMPERDNGKKIFIEFEGVRQAADVYVNGEFVGYHENGVSAFGFDITSKVKFDQENVIAVRVDNNWSYRERSANSGYEWSDRNFNANYGGIHKNTFLHVTSTIYQTLPLWSFLKSTGVYIYGSNYDVKNHSAIVNAESEVRNETTKSQKVEYEVVMEDMDSKEVVRFSGSSVILKPGESTKMIASSKVKDLHFWSWGYGYLYNVYTVLKIDGKTIDVVKTRTGFRKTEFRDGMVILNDRPIQMKGYAQRTSNEWPAVGNCVPSWMTDFSNGLALEGNANLFRWMHITPWRQEVQSFDRLGMMQMFPAGDAEKDVMDRRWGQRTELMHDIIIYFRNNPSILLWESGNADISEEHMKQMKAIRDEFDPNGGRAIGSRGMLASKTAEYGGEMLYINKSATKPLIMAEYCRDEALRKYWDEFTPPYHKDGEGPLHKGKPANEYNRNQDSYAVEIVKRWYDYYKERPGTGKRVNAGGVNIVFSETNTHHRGIENYRCSGEVDAMRIPKDAYFAHQVMWDGWVDMEKTRTYIVGHWNYSDTLKKDVYVISPAKNVRLLLNGKSVGNGIQEYKFLHTFKNVNYQKGTLKAISYDDKGNELSSYVLNSTGVPAAIRLKIIKGSQAIKADGADMVLAEFEIVDADGKRVPDVHSLVNFQLDGPAEWRGGIGQGPNNYILSKSIPAECGINRAIIRTTTVAGKVTLTATCDGLKPATITFETTPVKLENGLGTELPGDGLPSYLSRGETPSTPSYTITRKAVDVISATAGSNADLVAQSFDDNEQTQWTSAGKLANTWITYNLDHNTVLSEVCMKLSGFRTSSYPIVISVDGKVVWKGNTPQSLGYITLPLTPVKGKSITIRSIGANVDKDAFENMIEVNGKKESDGAKAPSMKSQLQIIEIEFYEAVKKK